MNNAYVQGFTDKCAACGVDAEKIAMFGMEHSEHQKPVGKPSIANIISKILQEVPDIAPILAKSAQASPGMMEQVGQRKPVAGKPQKSVAATPTLPAVKAPAPTGRLAQIGAMTQVPKTGKLTAA